MNAGEVTDNHKVVFMFEFVKRIDEMKSNKLYYSSNCIIRNLSWKILIEKKSIEEENEFEYVDLDSKDTLAVKLHCEGNDSKLWCTYAKIRLTLVSQKEGVESFSREFQNLFSSMTSVWGYSDFIGWDKVTNPENGFIKDNVLKFQAHVVAEIPQNSNEDHNRDMPAKQDDWLALFEENLNDKIVGRISTEFIRMNAIIEKAMKNEEIAERIVGAAVNSISSIIHTEVQALEKKLEKGCLNHITKVVREVKSKNLKENETTSNRINDLPEEKDVNASKKNLNGNEMHLKKVDIVEEETVPVSVLKFMKELIVEQQRTSFGWMPSLYGARAAYYRTNELHSYQPDPMRESEEFRLQKGLVYGSGSDSNRQSGDQGVDKCWEMKKGSVSPSSSIVQPQFRKNEKRKIEEIDNNCDNTVAETNKIKMSKPTDIKDENEIPSSADRSDKKLLFLGKNSEGEVETHKISHREQLLDLTKKYKHYKIWEMDEF